MGVVNTAYDLWEEGRQASEAQQYPQAIEKFKQAVAQDHEFQDGYQSWADALLKSDDPASALRELQTTVEQYYDKAMGHYIVGRAWYTLADHRAAAAEFEKAMAQDPSYTNAYIDAGLAYDNLGDYDKAIALYEKALALDPNSAVSYNNWGWALEQKGDLPGAVAQYKAALARDPHEAHALTNWALAIPKLPDPLAEIPAYREAVLIPYPGLAGHNKVGSLLLDLKAYPQATEEYKRAIAIAPEHPDAYVNCGLAYDYLGQFDDAIRYYEKAYALQPNSATTLNNWGRVLHEQKHYALAIEKYRAALAVDPKYDTALGNWAKAIKKLPEPTAELAAYRTFIETHRANADGYDKLGDLLLDLKLYPDALAAFQQAVTLAPDSAQAQLSLGVALHYTGDSAGAIQAYEAALQLKPDYALAYTNLAAQYALIGEYEKLLGAYQKAVAIEPLNESTYSAWSYYIKNAKDPEAELKTFCSTVLANLNTAEGQNLIGSTLYYHFKRYEEARRYFDKAIQMKPDLADAYFNLGNLLRDMFLYDEAIAQFERAIACKNHSYYYHNHADILQKLGRYKQARKKWREAADAYLRCEEDTDSPPDTWFYLYYSYICHEVFKDYASAEQALEKSLKLDPNNYASYYTLARVYLEQQENALSDSEADRKLRNVCNFKAWHAFRQAERLMKQKDKAATDPTTRLDLVELYLLFDKLEQAKDTLATLKDMDADTQKTQQKRGVLAMRLENFDEAVKAFKAVLDEDPDNLETRTNLARAYQKLKRNTEAENEYQHVLTTAGCHVDALIGLSEVFISEAEAADEKGNTGDALVYFNKAIYELNKLLDYTDPPLVHLPEVPQAILDATISRALTQKEISSIYYSLGYARTKLSEAKKFSNRTLLKQAMTNFRQVKFGTPNYFKAERACGKLEELCATLDKSASGTSTTLVAALSLIIFCLTQFGFFIGKPVLGYANLTVNHAALDTLLKDAKVDTKKFQNQIQSLKSSTFVLEQQIATSVGELLDKKELDHEQLNTLIQRGGKLQLKGFEKIGDATYALLTFGALIFMVAGLFLREITKLKFGAVELEKASMNQVSVTTSLNITR